MRKAIVLSLLLVLASVLPAYAQATVTATVNWTNPAGGAAPTGVKIERGTGPDPVVYTVQTTLAATATSYAQSGLAMGTRVCYRLTRQNALGGSPVVVCATPGIPSPVTGPTIIFTPDPVP